ncbi:MAG: hemolysin [Brevundimonas sp.]|nr:hemolysin [Brevundimonas sp.]
MIRGLPIASVLALAACAPVAGAPGGSGPQRCDAAANQSLVGTHVGAVSFPADANVRIVCTTCPTTRDLRPDRLNVRFDQATGIIRRVDCG